MDTTMDATMDTSMDQKIAMEPRKWSQEETYDLISFYRELRVLWDPTNRDYGLKTKRAEAIASLAEKFVTTESEINRKIHNLRCQYRGEVRNFNKKCSGTENCTSGWQFFDMMKEIMTYSTVRNGNGSTRSKRKANRANMEYVNGMIPMMHEQELSPADIYGRNPMDMRHPFDISMHRNDKPNDDKRRKTLPTAFDPLEPLWSANQLAPLEVPPIDDNQVFGNHVAQELRQLKKENQRMAKLRIARVLLEMGESDNTQFPGNPSIY